MQSLLTRAHSDSDSYLHQCERGLTLLLESSTHDSQRPIQLVMSSNSPSVDNPTNLVLYRQLVWTCQGRLTVDKKPSCRQGQIKGCWSLRLPGSRADFC